MPIDISLIYIKQNIPPELWEQLKANAHASKTTMLEYFVNILQQEVTKKPAPFTKRHSKRQSKIPEQLWAKAKAKAILEGKTLPELLTKIVEESCIDDSNS